MRVVASRAVVFVRECRLLCTAYLVVILFGVSSSFSHLRVYILTAEFFPAVPTPTLATACALVKIAVIVQAACKDVVAGLAFECPLLAPGTLLCILCHFVEVVVLS